MPWWGTTWASPETRRSEWRGKIFLVVVVFISSLFTGKGVLVARFAGRNEPDKVNRTVYQAFLSAGVLSVLIMAPLGYVLSPWLLGLVNATPEVQAEALAYLRIMLLFSFGMMLFFMLTGALRVAGVLLLRFVGSLELSAEAQAAYTVSYTQLFSLVTWTSVGLLGAAATVAGQNLGAGRPERTVAGVRAAARIGLIGAAVLGAAFLALPRQLVAAFGMSDPAVVELSVQLLRFLSLSGLLITVALTFTGGLSVARFRQGRWRGIQIEIGPAEA